MHGIDGIVEYFDKVVFTDRSSSSFDATGLELLGYKFGLKSTLIGGFGIDNGVDSVLDIFRRRIGMDVDLRRSKNFEAVVGVAARRTLGSDSFLSNV